MKRAGFCAEGKTIISELDNSNELIAQKIFALFQRSYKKEAELIGVDDFPPLRRSVQDLREAGSHFVACWERDNLIAVIETENIETL